MKRAIAYLRVSTGLQAEKGMGLEVQRETVTDYAREHGLELIDAVKETASGGVREGEIFSWQHRPALLELMDRAEAGVFEVLLVARLDRLSRDYMTLVALERQLQRFGVEVVSATEENGTGPIASYLRGNLALVAELERAMIRERLQRGKAAKKRLGRHVHGRVPYGYRSTDGILEPDPATAPVVQRIFAEVREGSSPGRVARELNRDGIPSPHGKTWSKQTVAGIVGNVAYAGERYGVKRAHEGLVSRRGYNAAQAALRARSRG